MHSLNFELRNKAKNAGRQDKDVQETSKKFKEFEKSAKIAYVIKIGPLKFSYNSDSSIRSVVNCQE